MASAADNFTVIEIDTNAAVSAEEAKKAAAHDENAGPNDGHDVVVTAEETEELPLWLGRTYLALCIVTVLVSFAVMVLSGCTARWLYLLAYKEGTVIPSDPADPSGNHTGPGNHPIVEPRRRYIFMSFLIYSPCVFVSYALMVTAGLPAFSVVRVAKTVNLSPSVQAQLKTLKFPNLIWLAVLATCMVATTVAFFIAPGKQWPISLGVAPLLASIASLGLMFLTWKM